MGDSSTMAILKNGRLEVVNSPSDTNERTDANALLIVAKVPEINLEVSKATTNKITINTEIINENGHDVDELFAGIDEQIKKVENNTLSFNMLSSNTEYTVKFYKKVNDDYIDLAVHNIVVTLKKSPNIIGVYVYQSDGDLIVQSLFDDPDSAIERSSAVINGKLVVFTNGKAKLADYNLDVNAIVIGLNIQVNLNDGNGRVPLDTVGTIDVSYYVVDAMISYSSGKVSNKIDRIFE